MREAERNLYKDISIRSEDLYALTKYGIILGLLANYPPLRIVNVGCGSGELCILLVEKGHSVLGVEPFPESVGLAKRSLEKKPGLDCSFVASSIEAFHSREPFDCVIACDVLEHVPDDLAAVQKMAQLVDSGGTWL